MRWLLDLLGGAEVSGYEGLSFQNPTRTPGNVDEAGSTIKHTLGKIENRRQAVLAELVDRRKEQKASLDVASLPDVYEPLRTLTKYLLPHLSFNKIDFKNEEDIKCVWNRSDANGVIEIDIDDLSSGEKSIIILFLPLLEDQIREKLQFLSDMTLGTTAQPVSPEERVILVDEPEQHLHPDLQSKILVYIRNVSRESKVQFVITTHSPTLLDQAFNDELFVLSEPSSDAAVNQLRRIANSAERLEALKQLAGSTYFLTTGRSIVCIEGEQEADTDVPTDVRLLEVMYPRATAVTLVPTRGKGNVITTVQRLREHVPEEVFRIRVRGLVDADQSTETVPGVEMLPVCMIENFLLDDDVVFDYVKTLEPSDFPDAGAVKAELDSIASSLVNDEVALRVSRRFKRYTVRVGGASVAQVRAKHQEELENLRNLLPEDEEVKKTVEEVTAEVSKIVSEGRALDRFRGKAILKEFYRRHVAPKNVGYTDACLELAKRVGKKAKIAERLDPVFDTLIT